MVNVSHKGNSNAQSGLSPFLVSGLSPFLKMIETWGRGIGVIAGECERCGLPLPRTEKCGGSVVTTFKRPKIGDKVENLDQDLDRGDPDSIQIDPDSFTQKLLQTIRRNPLISRKLLAVELNASERKIRESLKNLKDSGFIIRQGPDHGGIWRISRVVKDGVGSIGRNSGGDVANHDGHVVNRVVNNVANEKVGVCSLPEAVIQELRVDSRLSAAKLANKLDVASRTIQRVLKALQESGRICRVGGTRGAWEVVA